MRRAAGDKPSVIVLLRPAADGPAMTGRLQWRRADGRSYLTFGYEVVRVWERPAEEVLAGWEHCRWRPWPTSARECCRE